MAGPTLTETPTAATVDPEHKPYVADQQRLPEFTWPALIVGAVLGIIFGASSLYLVLKVGLTVSASIPVAVLSITLFRLMARLPFIKRANILENNIVQTTGSAGESIAFGVGVTMPALMLLGFEMDIGRVMVVSILGGLLGILMMIPLRRAFIVKQHGILKYPEGTACADVLIAGEEGGTTAKTVFAGFGLAFVYQFLWQGFKFWKEGPAWPLRWFKGATPSIEVNPALLGVGYIIGTRISCIMVAGGVLASFVLIPAIRLFGHGLDEPLYPASQLIRNMSEEDLWHEYVLYIGAGAVAAGGIISLFQALPLIINSIGAGIRDIRASRGGSGEGTPRTDRDLPLWIVGAGSLSLVLAIWATTPLHKQFHWIPDLNMHFLGAILIVLFGFLFVTVSSRLTGEIGSSSNPISGMTVATLLLTCLIFLSLGWIGSKDRLTALSVAAVVCIAASNGGTTSQDLKTGFLVGATPKWQQLSILVGSLSSALVIGWILIQLNNAYTIYTKKDLPRQAHPANLSKLEDRARGPDGKEYLVWRTREQDYLENPDKVPQGKYLVDEQGWIVYLVDPGINGKRSHRDDGTEVPRFKAPKAVLMGFITDGILGQKLPWSLVLLGVSIAIVLELCSVPSLPFAVGVYLPLSSSTPIFVGGLARWAVDKWNARATGKVVSETESDTSPGVLLSTGYIAGGAIAGVLIAFLSFNEKIPNLLATWQYRRYIVTAQKPFKALTQEVARHELGLEGQIHDLAVLGATTTLQGVSPWGIDPIAAVCALKSGQLEILLERQEKIEELAGAVDDLNQDELPRYVTVPEGAVLKIPAIELLLLAGTVLQLPGDKTYEVKKPTKLGDIAQEVFGSPESLQQIVDLNHLHPEYHVNQETSLGDIAKEILGSPGKAQLLVDLNKLEVPKTTPLPPGSTLKIPQGNGLAVVAFGILTLILVLVGCGWLLKSPPTPGLHPQQGAGGNGPHATGDRMDISEPQT